MKSTSAARTTISVLRVSAGRLRIASAFAVALLVLTTGAYGQSANDDSKDKDKGFDVKSSVGDMHVGNDGDVRATGLPAYPGARLKKDDKDGNNANLALFTSAFGFKLIVVKYESDDAPDKVITYYRGKLKKYGKVVECHTSKHGVDISPDNDDSSKSKELKCDDNETGSGVELKVGTQDNQHIVAIEPAESGSGSTFAIVYVYTRGKQADI
jgi:hypothetical protein